MAAVSSSTSTSTANSDLKWRVTEIAQCPICLEDFKNPKSLPCVHSFCLHCLQDLCKDKQPRDTVPCPVCRKEFEIPEKGLVELPHNFFVQNLIDAKEASSEQLHDVMCEACVADNEDGQGDIPPATMYCVDCNQKLCGRCSRPHKVMKGRPHQVKELGAELTVELIQQRGSYCDQHPDKPLELYCFTCNTNVCMKCFAVAHPQPQHACKEIEKASKDFASNIDSDLQSISTRVEKFHAEIKQTDDEDHRFMSVIDEMAISARQRGEDIKRTIDSQVDKLEADLETFKLTNQKAVAARKDKLELGLRAMESFTAYSLELKSKGSACDITRAANDLHSRAKELLQTYVRCGDYCAPDVKFVPSDVEGFIKGGQNFVGRVLTSEAMNVVKTLKAGSDGVVGLTMLHQELFVLHERAKDQVSVYSAPHTSTDLTRRRRLTVNGLSKNMDNDMTSSVRSNCLFMSDHGNKCVHKVATHGHAQAKWRLSYTPVGLSLTPCDNLLVTCGDAKKLIELNSDNGECVREIALQSDIEHPWHAVQLASQLYVVSHGWRTGLHRVCVVDVDGKLSLSYGRQQGSDTTQLNEPRHVITDTDNFVYVADLNNARLAVLSPSLQLIFYVKLGGLPRRLYLDRVTRRLYVSYYFSRDIAVIQV